MLAKKYRLANSREIQKVFQKGGQIKSRFLAIRFCKSIKKNSRLAVIISNKISKKATIRNKLRRQMKSIFFNLQKNFSGNYDMIIIGRSGIVGMAFQEMKCDIEAMLHRAKII